MKIILRKDFTKDQEILAKKLYSELVDNFHELEEYSSSYIYGLRLGELKDEENSVLIGIDYSEPEKDGNKTIFGNY